MSKDYTSNLHVIRIFFAFISYLFPFWGFSSFGGAPHVSQRRHCRSFRICHSLAAFIRYFLSFRSVKRSVFLPAPSAGVKRLKTNGCDCGPFAALLVLASRFLLGCKTIPSTECSGGEVWDSFPPSLLPLIQPFISPSLLHAAPRHVFTYIRLSPTFFRIFVPPGLYFRDTYFRFFSCLGQVNVRRRCKPAHRHTR